MYRITQFSLVALALSAILLTGCGEVLDTEPVTGKVTLDGDPVEGATVNFRPVDPEVGCSATGITDAEGIYKLTATDPTAKTDAGTLPGEYQITVFKNQAAEVVSTEEAEESGGEATTLAPGQDPEITYHVPKKYNMERTSGLKETVKEGENEINLELTSD